MAQKVCLREKCTGKYIEWKVKNFFTTIKKRKYSMESPTFTLSDAEWCILIQSNDADIAEVSTFSMILKKRSSSSKEYDVSYSIGIKSRDGSKYKSKCVRYVSKVRGSEPKTDDGKMNNCMTVEVHALRKSENELSSDRSLTVFCDALILDAADVGTMFSVPVWTNRRHTDTTINVRGRVFKVHRSILSAQSSVFGLMFEQDKVKKYGLVNIDDCEPDTFQDFLLYVYTGKTDHVTSENAPGLYRIANKYDTPLLKKECTSLMSKGLTVQSFCDVVLLASTYDDPKLMAASTGFFIENFRQIFPTPKFVTLLSEKPKLTQELLVTMGNSIEKRLRKESSNTDDPVMRIHVKFLDGKFFDISAVPSDTLEKLLEKISNKTGFDIKDIKLIYNARYLGNEERTLSQHDIRDGSTVHLVHRLRG